MRPRSEAAGDAPSLPQRIQDALRGFEDGRLRDRASELLGVLGYESERWVEDFGFGADEFLDWADESAPERRIAKRPRELIRESWDRIEMVFQYTEAELEAEQADLFGGGGRRWQEGRAKSFLFLAVELKAGDHPRHKLAAMTRAVNRPLMMPAIVFFRHRRTDESTALTLAVIHRRAHKADADRDVLERATLIKDIRVARPHRAHVDALAALALESLTLDARTFDALHAAWERVLDTEELNRRFYTRLFEWFERAVQVCSFPDDGAGEGNAERHVIRMITRILFIWFLKEKRLVPERFFEESFAAEHLKNHAPDATDYYRAVLQNLFFATLNTPIGKRSFSHVDKSTHRDFTRYRYADLLKEPERFKQTLGAVPFVNGGLFDCLDTFEHTRGGGRRIDVFTDNPGHRKPLNVPAGVFFDPDTGLFPLLGKYKFTVEENTPLDQEVALDPELLGKAFENLLAAYNPETREHARKRTGSYYTPREVVDYMVREALVEHLSLVVEPYDGDRAWLKERLGHLFDIKQGEGAFGGKLRPGGRPGDDEHLMHAGEIDPLIEAIDALRIIDPACGSGAFPMGVLHKLVMALARIDPRNERWKARQARAAERIVDPAVRRSALRTVELAFSRERAYGDFGRKLYLIQNVIHGVDIQPIATQIAKLRFFISLVIEQPASDDEESNFGLEPLPNLETCFVAADSLKRLDRPDQAEMRSRRVAGLEEELRAHRRNWFDAHDRDAKWELRKRDLRLRERLEKALVEDGWDEGAARQVAGWDAYDQNARAGWFDPEWMFGHAADDAGFDIVIGNPPYIQLQKAGGLLADRYQNDSYVSFTRSGDIYVLFCERGAGLLRQGTGVLAYITSNSWLRARYGMKLRRLLADAHTPLRLVEMGKEVFENTIVDSAVVLVRQGGCAGPLPALDLERLGPGASFPEVADADWGEARPAGDAPWGVMSRAEWGVMDKMRRRGIPLKEWDVSIRRGVLTGLNAAFIIDDETRAGLVAEDARSDEIIRPILRGRDVRRWRAEWAGLWLIYSHSEVAEHDYPAIRAHLLPHRKKLLARRGGANPRTGKVPYEWWQLQVDYYRSGAYRQFAKEKLFWMDMSPMGRFALSGESMFCNNAGYMITGASLRYLCCILNSQLTAWYVEREFPTSGMGVLRWWRFVVESIPIPRLPPAAQRPFAAAADRILARLDADPKADVSAPEAELNRLVYDLYGLSEDEVRLVERAAP